MFGDQQCTVLLVVAYIAILLVIFVVRSVSATQFNADAFLWHIRHIGAIECDGSGYRLVDACLHSPELVGALGLSKSLSQQDLPLCRDLFEDALDPESVWSGCTADVVCCSDRFIQVIDRNKDFIVAD
jgi:hypothetical protein